MTSIAVTRRRRKDVLHLMALGWSYEVIAEELGLPVATVQQDGYAILQRLGMTRQLELVVAAWKAGQESLKNR